MCTEIYAQNKYRNILYDCILIKCTNIQCISILVTYKSVGTYIVIILIILRNDFETNYVTCALVRNTIFGKLCS